MIKANNGESKAGRPTVLDAAKKMDILQFIERGGSRNKAAEYVGVHHSTVTNEAKRDPGFLANLTRAEASCYDKHLKRWLDSDDWRAHCEFMARKWPSEFAKVNKVAETDSSGQDLSKQERHTAIAGIMKERFGDAAGFLDEEFNGES